MKDFQSHAFRSGALGHAPLPLLTRDAAPRRRRFEPRQPSWGLGPAFVSLDNKTTDSFPSPVVDSPQRSTRRSN